MAAVPATRLPVPVPNGLPGVASLGPKPRKPPRASVVGSGAVQVAHHSVLPLVSAFEKR